MINCSEYQASLWPLVEVWPPMLSMNPKTLKNYLSTRLNDMNPLPFAFFSVLKIFDTILAYCESYSPLLPFQSPCLGSTHIKSPLEELPLFLGI